MRLDLKETEYLKHAVKSCLPTADVYLFGSRIKDDLKGGDIDLLVIAERELSFEEKRQIKIGYYKRFGERRIDIVSFCEDDSAAFKQLALLEAEVL